MVLKRLCFGMSKPGTDQSQAWRCEPLGGAIFLRAEYRQQRFDRHFHEEFAIGIIERGCQAFAYDGGRRLDMPGGTVALISPGIVHSGWPGADEGWRYRMLYPSVETVCAAVSDIFGSDAIPAFDRPVVMDDALFGLLSRLHAASESPAPDALEIEELFVRAIRASLQHHAGLKGPEMVRGHAPGLRRVRELIEARHGDALSLAELAGVAGLSRFQMLRQFKTAFGLPPHAYLRLARVRRARAMVLDGEPLADTALAAGFADQAHMTRAFRSILGYTPGALARGALARG